MTENKNVTPATVTTLTADDVKKTATTLRTRFHRADTTQRAITWDAAILVRDAVASGILSTGAGKTEAAYTGKTFAEAIDKSGAYVTLLRRCARAIDLGVVQSSPTWKWLVQNGQKKSVGDLLAVETTTLADLERLMADMSSDVKPVAVAVPPVAEKTADEKRAETGPAMPRNNSGILDLIETAMANLTVLTPAESKRLGDIIDALGSLPTASIESLDNVA